MNKFTKSIFVIGLGLSTLITSQITYADDTTSKNSASQQVQVKVADGVVATYTGQDNKNHIVLLSDLKPYLKNPNLVTQAELKRATEQFILKNLRTEWEKRAKASVKVSRAEVDDILYNEAAKNGLTFEDFTRALAYQGISVNTLRQNIYNSLYQAKMHAFLTQNVEAKIDHASIEMQGYKNYQQAKKEGKLKSVDTKDVSYILIKTSPVVSSAEAKAKAEQISKELSSNKISFSEAARQYSDDIVSAANNGYLGQVAKLPDGQARVMQTALQKLKPGQVTKPIYLPNLGWAVVRYDKNSHVEADVSYYINEVFKEKISTDYAANTLDQFLLNSVKINYLNAKQ